MVNNGLFFLTLCGAEVGSALPNATSNLLLLVAKDSRLSDDLSFRRRPFRDLEDDDFRLLLLLHKVFMTSADMNKAIPVTCSIVHSLSKIAKLINRVVAFRTVDVRDMVMAPKFFVMAAEQEDPKNPMVENKIRTPILYRGVQYAERSSRGKCNSPYFPVCPQNRNPS